MIEKHFPFFVFLVSTGLLFTSQVFGQNGAAQAVRRTADNLQEKVANQQDPLTAGPEDKFETTKPGKIDADAERKFKTTESGLKYRILRKSDGKKPNAEDEVTVDYKGWLDDKTIFDSTYQDGKPISFPLNKVIKGWTEGMQLVGVGGMIELEIPSSLGYGDRGTPGGPIPPKATLHFVVELISISDDR